MNMMNRREWMQRVVAGSLGAGLAPGLFAAESHRPNIVLILADDLGYAELGAYGNTFHETPHLDRLAREGMRFTEAYAAAPVCSPTRASIMTGQYPLHVGISDYLRHDDENHLRPAAHFTLAEALKEKGYATGMIGKWHLMGDYTRRRGAPELHGFDEAICTETSYIGPGDYHHPYEHMKEVKARKEKEYLTDRLGQEAADFIDRHQEDPFFLYLSFYSVHTRLDGRKDLVEKYRNKPGAGKARNQNNPELAAMVESVDQAVGRVLKQLEEAGLDKNTLVLFMSDNGGESRVTKNIPLRGGKSQLYEGGIREPMIARWPGMIPAGSECAAPVSSIDFYPTLIDAAGGASEKQPFDGVSLLPALQGKAAPDREALYWHYPLEKPHFLGGRSSGAIRQGDWKLIEFFDTGAIELYNLKADIAENKNLAAAQPEKAAAILQALKTWRSQYLNPKESS